MYSARVIVRSAFALVAVAGAAVHADVVRVANSYVAQTEDRWCGPASGLMQLNSPGASVAAMPTQLAMAQKIRAGNSAWNFYTTSDTALSADPDGMKSALNFYDRVNTYQVNTDATYNAACNTLVNTLQVGGVADSVLTKGGLHWVDVRGYKTVANPTPGQPDVLDGFYVRDPWNNRNNVAGIGVNEYVRNTAGGWQQYYNPVSAQWRGTWGNQFVSVSASPIDAGSWVAPVPGAVQPIQLTSAQAASVANSYMTSNLSMFTSETPAFSPLGSFAANSTLLTWAGAGSNTADYLLPYYQSSGSSQVLTGVALLNSYTGDVDQVSWLSSFGSATLSDVTSYYSNLYANGLPGDNIPGPGGLAILSLSGLLASRRRRR